MFVMIRTALALLVPVSCSFGQTVFSSDFDGSLPAEVDPGLATLTGVQGFSALGHPGAQLARRQDLGFSGPGGYFTDSAYDFSLEPRMYGIPHTASTLTLEYVIEGVGTQSLGDESWAIDNLTVAVTNGPAPQNPVLTNHKVTYPVGTVPRFTGLLHGATPIATATLQSSTDLGITDAWQDLISTPVNVNGSASFIDVPDPSADNAPRNFYRVRVVGP